MNVAMINLLYIHPSKINPRTAPTKEGMAELVASIRDKGILNPLIVRPLESGYEVVCGHRRLAAAFTAGHPAVPALVRDLTDEEAQELALIDNLQRENLSPLEEAAAYGAIQKQSRCDTATLAKKVGKSRQYVAQRLSLLELHPKLQKELTSGRLLLGDALKIARVGKDTQMVLLDEASQPEESARSLSWAVTHSLTNLSSAPWKMDDGTIAGKPACNECPKRTSQRAELFPEVAKGDHCLDDECFKAKMDGFVELKKGEAEKEGRQFFKIRAGYATQRGEINQDQWRISQKGCKSPATGLRVDGVSAGKVAAICVDPKCKACWKGADRPASSRSSAAITPQARYKRRMEIWNNRVEQEVRERTWKALVPRIKGPANRLHLIAMLVEVENRNHGSIEDVAELLGKNWSSRVTTGTDLLDFERKTEGWTDDEILQTILGLTLQQEMIKDPAMGRPDATLLGTLLQQHGFPEVDVAGIRRVVALELETRRPKPPKEEPKPETKSAKSGTKRAKAETTAADPDESGDAMRPTAAGRRRKRSRTMPDSKEE